MGPDWGSRPWTAIKLIDYYTVRRGQYVIREIFNPAVPFTRMALTRSLDLSEERRLEAETHDELEMEARAHLHAAEA